ncbi:dihydroxyacetone kinase subunit DhaK [Sporolactobacillus inulinus]|uniref:DhaKLM operon coactivator DhaQ n=1 Tax=Sporolactobacillus inulinus CASD TaxID=1069536 RepID=A0A0U1QRE1_9BACL|nr:dihydroxyacetone kinase subunit DhaK [Sporolactobacillus inulinus]KLI03348.1 DhaKLM operon coactivator DhaQ [Sporolactobacillus inulinus CASD]GEB78008.1 dihydroxyacetone kinase subunit DhaK [Sporolactobacillus inulinus]
MKKIINHKADIIEDMFQGIAFNYQDLLTRIGRTGIFYSKKWARDRVAVIGGGGSGHEPTDTGYVGDGMLTAAVCGELFTPPKAELITRAIKEVAGPEGVLLVVKNFKADIEAFNQAAQWAKQEGIPVEMVIVADDISTERLDRKTYALTRRGVAGTVFVQKIIGAAAASGLRLPELKNLGDQVVEATKTLGVALSPSTITNQDKVLFSLQEDEIYFGIGIHGEPGYRIEKMHSSERLAIELMNKLKNAFAWKKGETFAIMVNGLGSTPLMDQFIFVNDVGRLIGLYGLKTPIRKTGNYMTSNDMYGISLTFLRLADPQWLRYLQMPTDAYAWK